MTRSLVLLCALWLVPAGLAQTEPVSIPWHYGGFVDLGYLYDPNTPSNHLFRDRATTPVVDQPNIDMAALYVKKDASEASRWGMELTLQGGKDSEAFGFSAVAPNLPGSRWLRHIGLADVSYLAPVGSGLTIQGGIFASLIGYDGLYAKDNLSYTRPWGADNTPYLMMGVNASYGFTKKLTATFAVVNDYAHLADPNHVPSVAAQAAYKPNDRVTVKQTVLYGPHQSDTAPAYWRFLSDTIVERKTAHVTTAFEYQVGEERVALTRSERALWMSAQLPLHWAIRGPWSFTLRPEFCWDRDGRWTGSPQLVTAITSTLEYRVPYRWTNTIVRVEHRYDHATGRGGGFFQDDSAVLTPGQNLLAIGLIFTLDSPTQRQP
ncbi:MAG TPA: outer membrane beta-barrel protein [Candidatus Sulfopaludibacter sp.]|jgi:hypothetical protein|nr:outer membrane beta-barrel protein [Candidatus Sulfopaludibacter sp.]